MADRHDRYARVRRHLDNPSCSHLKGLITDVVSILEDQQNFFQQLMESKMNALSDELTKAVAALAGTIVAHDAAVNAAISGLQAASAKAGSSGDPIDPVAVQAAIDALTAAGVKLTGETASLVAAQAAPVQQAASAAAQSAVPDSAASMAIQTNAVAAATAADPNAAAPPVAAPAAPPAEPPATPPAT